ncbi:hypothetical protein, partial [Salmonella enterica]|uniref:hypothetical protein n=1 Tax=Salmonella enterica TaxID=28901 RepID=UPI003CF88C1C
PDAGWLADNVARLSGWSERMTAGGLAPAGGAAFACVFSWRFACPERQKNVQNPAQIPLQDVVQKKEQKAVQKSVLKE